MPLVVPLLRISLLFLNIYETFKTLKIPRPSSRTGEASVRAMTQRKRDMKGCMAVWLVWTCFTTVERTADNVIGIFIPFYDEFKALALLFLLLTRARGAEPIYLYVLRPMIKPYASTLDWSLDMIHTFGDFAALLLFLPFTSILEWWNPTQKLDDHITSSRNIRQGSAGGQARAHATADDPDAIRHNIREEDIQRNDARGPTVGTRTRRQALNAQSSATAGPSGTSAISKQPNANGDVAFRKPNGIPVAQTRRAPESLAARSTFQSRKDVPQSLKPRTAPQHIVWHPPSSSYDSTEPHPQYRRSNELDIAPAQDAPPMSMPVPHDPDPWIPPPSIPQPDITVTAEVEDWRLYPPFPSAYPPTPLPAVQSLPALSDSIPQIRLRSVSENFTSEIDEQAPNFGNENGGLSEDAGRPTAASTSRSLPSRTGARRTGRALYPQPADDIMIDQDQTFNEQGFGLSLERPRESSTIEDSSSRSGSGDGRQTNDINGVPQGFEAVVDDNMEGIVEDVEGPTDSDGENTEGKSGNRNRARVLGQRVVRKTIIPTDQPLLRARAQAAARDRGGGLKVPTATTSGSVSSRSSSLSRTNSHSTALSTASGASSLRTMSRNPSNAATPISATSSTDSRVSDVLGSDVSSVIGMKRPLAREAKVEGVLNGRLAAGRKAKAAAGAKVSENRNSRPNPRTTGAKTAPPTNSKPFPKKKQSSAPRVAQDDDMDTLESSDERRVVRLDMADDEAPATKRRRVAPMERTNIPNNDKPRWTKKMQASVVISHTGSVQEISRDEPRNT